MSDNVVGKLERRRHWVWQQAGWHEEALRLRHLFPRILFHVTCNLKTLFNFEAGLLLAFSLRSVMTPEQHQASGPFTFLN